MEAEQFEKLVTDARKRGSDRIEAAKQKYGLGRYSRYEIDLAVGTIRFLDEGGVEKVRSKVQVAGSWGAGSETWLWAWDNDSVPETVRAKLSRVQAFGEEHEIEPLMGSFDRCSEADAWSMASLAADLLDAECIYRAPGKTSALFLLLFDIGKSEAGPSPRVKTQPVRKPAARATAAPPKRETAKRKTAKSASKAKAPLKSASLKSIAGKRKMTQKPSKTRHAKGRTAR